MDSLSLTAMPGHSECNATVAERIGVSLVVLRFHTDRTNSKYFKPPTFPVTTNFEVADDVVDVQGARRFGYRQVWLGLRTVLARSSCVMITLDTISW